MIATCCHFNCFVSVVKSSLVTCALKNSAKKGSSHIAVEEPLFPKTAFLNPGAVVLI